MKKLFALIPVFFSLAALPSMAQNCGGNFTQYQVLSRTNGENFRQFSDINRDGKTDLITQDNSAVARFYLNTGSGFTAAGSLQLPLFGNVVAVKDFDNDGWADILSNSITGQTCLNNQIRIFWNTGQNNSFFNTGLSTNLPLPVNPYCMQSQDIDFNGDGLLDIISTSMPFAPSTNSPGRTYRNNGNRNFTVAADNLWPRDLYGTHTRDFNGDGKADFLVTIKDGWADGLRGMYYYRGNGNGTFQPVIVNFNSAPLAAGGFPIQADPLVNSTEDVIMSLNGVSPATVKLARWNGSSNFTFTDISIPAGFAAGQAFDLNKDGRQDIILFSTAGQTSVRAMLGNGNGGFTAEPTAFLEATSYNLGTMFSDASNAIQYVSGSNASSMVIYRRSTGQPSSISLNQSACLSYRFNGQTYAQSGTYIWTGTNASGCDSLVTLNLTINQPSAKAIDASINEGQTYDFNGQTLTQAGTYTATLQNAAGCDSVVTLTLTVIPPACSIAASKSSICAGETVTLTASVSGTSGQPVSTIGLPANLQQGLVGYWPFNGNANDMSGNGNHGQAFGSPTYVQGVRGQGLKLNGINSTSGSGNPDRIRVPNSPSLQFSNKLSVAYWVKIDGNQVQTPQNCSGSAIPGISGTVLAKSGDRFGIYFSEYETGSGFGVNPYYGGIGGGANGLPTAYQNYRHVAYSIDNNTISLYINGVLKSVSNGNVSYGLANNHDLNIGVQNNAGGACLTYWYPINGVLDDICMWNRTLTASEVQQLYAPNTVSYLWSTGETTPSISVSPTANTTYSCTITSGTQSCTAEKTIAVKQKSTSSETKTACNSFTWNGQTYTQSGTYTWTGTNAAGCDSVVTLNLTINQPSSKAISASINEGQSYDFNGQTLTQAGTYTATLQNAAGCDSVVTLTLTVNAQPLSCSVTASKNSICTGETVTLTASASGGAGSTTGNDLPSNLQQGLVGYWPFSGNANDMSGNDNHGTVHGATLTKDRFGNINSAYTFNGTSDYIIANSVPALNGAQEYSFGAWVKHSGDYYDPNCSSGCVQFIVSRGWDFTSGNFRLAFTQPIQFGSNGYKWYAMANSLLGGALSNSQYPVPQSDWSFVMAVKVGNLLKLYINGEFNSSYPVQGALGNNNSPLIIGKHILDPNGNFPYFMNGFIDDVIVYNRALNNSEVVQLMNLESPASRTFLWSTGETTPSISVSPTANTTYSCTITSGNQSCTAEKTIAVNQKSASSETKTACSSFIWNGQTYSQSGTYTWTGTNAAGCDSVVTMNLTITPATSNTTTASACGSYTWSVNGQTYTQGGTYSVANGCQTEVLNLTITPATSNTTTASACGSYTWSVNGQTYTQGGTYSVVNGCQTEVLNLTINQPATAPSGIMAPASSVQSGQSFTLSVSGGSLGTGATWKWYTGSCGGTFIGTGASISVSQTANTTYFVRAEGPCGNTACASRTISMTASTCGDGRFAEQVISFNQRKAINGTAVISRRSQSSKALCAPQNNDTENFVSLGFGGDITLKFGKAIRNGAGNDIRVYETTWGNMSCTSYPEKARVFASQDGCRFVYLGEICQDGTVDLGSLEWAHFVRIVDVSSTTAVFSGGGIPDGFDLDGVEALNGFAVNPVTDAFAGGASEVVSYLPGRCRGGAAIPLVRTDRTKALGIPQGTDVVNFVSLGFGGKITLRFKYAVVNNPTNPDLQVVETSYGNPSCNAYPEKATFEGSLDGISWTSLGQLCLDGTLEMGSLPYLHFLRITDASDPARFSSSADGFDVDGVVAINQCSSSNTREASEIVDDIHTEDELETAGILELYPNPARGSATFTFSSETETPYQVNIINALGQVIQNQTGNATEGANTLDLNLEGLKPGLYIVQVINGNQRRQLNLICR